MYREIKRECVSVERDRERERVCVYSEIERKSVYVER